MSAASKNWTPNLDRMKRELIPAVLAHSAEEAETKMRQIERDADWIQIDVMDGRFVPNTTWSDAVAAKKWKTRSNIELHLMVNDPAKYIRQWKSHPRFKRAIWHVEIPIDHGKLIAACRRMKLEVGLAISPETPLAALIPFLRKIQSVLILGVHPGWSGQKLIPSAMKKSADLRRLMANLPIGFDGHVTSRNLTTLAKNGVTRFYVASAIFKKRDPAKALRVLKKMLTTVT